MNEFYLLFFLLGASFFDFLKNKIPNLYILIGLMGALIIRILEDGGLGLVSGMIGMIWPVALFYVFFLTGTMGSGDLKCMGLAGVLMSFDRMLLFLTISFAAGAVTAMIKMTIQGNLLNRISLLMGYISDCVCTKSVLKYPACGKEGKMRMAPCMMTGAVIMEVIIIKGGL